MTKVFVFMGQSNAEGRGIYILLDPVPAWAQNTADGWTGAPTVSSDSGVQYEHPTAANLPYLYSDNNSGLAADEPTALGPFVGCNATGIPFHPGQQSAYGPEVSFLTKYRADFPTDDVAVLKVVLGGSSIDDWLTGGMSWWPNAISNFVSLLNAQGKTAEWAGLIWMQGESGASDVYHFENDPPTNDFLSKTRAFFAQVRAATSASLPIALGRISNSMLAAGILDALPTNYTVAQYTAATNGRRSDQQTVGGDAGNAWWDNDNLPVLTTDPPAFQYHFTGAGYLAMGERAFAAWQQAAGITPPPPPQPLVVTFNGTPEAWVVQLNGTVIGKPGDTISITG